ncbi:hypothetical protein [Mycolicibacterium fluoranthenivorans]|uniref:Uncharacterized protein n=1 Tax=Mycolicibacterium fluoranthenivorans TaxID=258505 RepID=A0A1G4WRE5_9MYCO|nr:hypothetical protein [Mycolicibacterium fluoranthenivorans]SCX27225.1 hypothetical protein SAMN02799620_04251 [Mycolicibacterium fluoranthenivorans]
MQTITEQRAAQAHEARVRRRARRGGYKLRKLRDGDGYWLIDNDTNVVVVGHAVARGCLIGYELDMIEEHLDQ